MSRKRAQSVIAAAIVGVVLLLLLASQLAAIDLKPHPLFGDNIIGNSAEILRIWKPTTGSDPKMRTVDFDRASSTLIAKPHVTLPDGASGTLMQQMDSACGDFDGDNRDDIIVAYSSDHDPQGNFQDVNLMVPQVDPETLELVPGTAMEHGFVMSRRARPEMGHTAPANIQMASGNFYAENDTTSGLNIEEFVLGTRIPAGFCGELSAYDHFGDAQAVLEDLDGDGNRELAVGAPWDDDGGENCGAVWILFLDDRANVRHQQKISQLRGGFTETLSEWDQFGYALASMGDSDGDGVGDLAVGAHGADDGGFDRGVVWMLYLNPDGTVKSQEKIGGPRGAPLGVYTAVSAGGTHSLGLKNDGSIVAWGDDHAGQCNVPAPNSDFIAVAGGGWYFSVGLKSDGSIVAWGEDDYGQLNLPSPNTDFEAIAAGFGHGLGLKGDGSIVGWGDNSEGQCNVPAPNSEFVAIAAGAVHSLGLKSGGSIVAWGYNYYGQCDVPEPNTDFVAIAAGRSHSLGLKANGSIVAWGRDYYGQCQVPEPNSDFVAVAAGAIHSLGLKSDGSIETWGGNNVGQLDVPLPNTDFVAVAASGPLVGGGHNIGLKSDGRMVAWGEDSSGQCAMDLVDDSDYFGWAVELIGDLDGNGVAELAVGAPCDDDQVVDGGAIWIFFRDADGTVSDTNFRKISGTYGGFTGVLYPNEELGLGDGLAWLDDFNISNALAVGAYRDNDGGSGRGAVWILFLDEHGQVLNHTKISDTSGNLNGTLFDGDGFGRGVACLQSPDHDGNLQIAVGVPHKDGPGGSDDWGGVWLLSLAADGSLTHHHELDIANEVTSFAEHDAIGVTLVSFGDLDGNGADELGVGAPGRDAGGQPWPPGSPPFWDEGSVRILGLADDGANVSIDWDDLHDANGQADIQIELMELVDGQPSTLATAFVEHSNFSLLGSARFDVAAGDFDLDGVDEIVVAGVRDVTPFEWCELFIKIFAYDQATGTLVEKGTGSASGPGVQPAALDGRFQGIYLDRIALATGPLDPASVQDHIVLAWEDRRGGYVTDFGCPNFSRTRFHLAGRFQVVSVNPDWTLRWQDTCYPTFYDYWYDDVCLPNVLILPSDWYYWFTGTGVGIALADLNVDGVNEIVIAGGDRLRVYQTTVAPDGAISCNQVGDAALSLRVNDAAPPLMVADLDAEESLDDGGRMWRPEIIVADYHSSAGGDQRCLKVFSAELDSTVTPPAITGLDPVCVSQEGSDIEADAVATLAGGDFDGDALRLGAPIKYHYDDVVQPLVVLNTPPVHFDVLDGEELDICGCFGGGGCECFDTRHSSQTITDTTLVTNVHSDWGAGISLDYSVDLLLVSWNVKMKAIYGDHFSRTGTQGRTFKLDEYHTTQGWPKMRATITDYDFYEYPVFLEGELINYVGVAHPATIQSDTFWLQYTDSEWNSGANPVTTDPGNLFSYRLTRPAADDPDIAEIWWEPDAYTVGPPLDQDCDYWRMEYAEWSQNVQETSWDFGFEQSGWGGTYTSYALGEITTHSSSITESMALYGDKGDLAPGLDASFRVYPFIYRSTSGAIVVDYAARPVVEPYTLWGNEYQIPDLAFVLPFLYYDVHGWDPNWVLRQYESPDIRVMPRQAAVGDTVRITARLHNYSTVDQPDIVEVSFFLTTTDGSTPTPIVDLGGQSLWTTFAGIAAQDTATVSIDWEIPSSIPDLPRIYAAIDPNGLIVETHDEAANRDNNRGFTYLYAVGGGTTAVGGERAPAVFALHQNYPNPCNPATTIAFSLPSGGPTTLKIYDVTGRLATTLVDDKLSAGVHQYIWEGRDDQGRRVASGIYFYRVESGAFAATKKMVVLK